MAPGSPHPVPLELLSIKTPPPSSPVPSVLCCLLPSLELLLGHKCQLCVLGSLEWGDGKWGDGNPAGTAPLGDTGAAPSALWGLGGGGGSGGHRRDGDSGGDEHGGTPWGRGHCRDDCCGLQEGLLPTIPFHHSSCSAPPGSPMDARIAAPSQPPGTWGDTEDPGAAAPHKRVGVSRAQEPLVRPRSRTQPHTNGFCSPQPSAGGPRGWCGRWYQGAALPRPHPVPIPWPCQGRTAVTQRSGSRRGRMEAGGGGKGVGQGEDGALPWDELTASSSPRYEVRGCGQHRGSPDVPRPPQRHLQLRWLPGARWGAQPSALIHPKAGSTSRIRPRPHNRLGVLQGMGAAHPWSPCHPAAPLQQLSAAPMGPQTVAASTAPGSAALGGGRGQRPHSGGRRRAAKGTETAESSQKSSVLYFILQSQKELQGGAVRPTWVGDGGTHRWGHGTPSPALHPALQQSTHGPRAVGQAGHF